jgi:2-keto-4-pentenoate hydratase
VTAHLGTAERTLLELLREARARGQLLPSQNTVLPLEAAYQVQKALGQGREVVGYKLGFVSEAKQRQMGIWEPIYGRVYADAIRVPPVSLAAFRQPKVEPELVAVLEKDLPAGSSPARAGSAIGGFALGLEVLDSVWEGYRFTLTEVVADNASAAAFVLSDDLLTGPPEELSLYLEGKCVSRGPVAGLGDPASRLAWLAERVGGLRAGQMVFLGSPAEAVPARPGAVQVGEGEEALRVLFVP